MKHIGLKITAFLFGIALWLYVMSLNTFQITMDVPVRLVKLPEVLAVASKPPQTINVTIEGAAFDLMRLRNRINHGDSTIAAVVIDLQDAELGPTRKHIYAKNFVCPAFPNVKFVEPDNQLLFVDLELDTRIDRNIPIRSNVIINAANGYLVTDEPKLDPDFITVYGARNAITRIIEIPTDSVNFDTLKHDSIFPVALNFEQLSSFVSPNIMQTNIKVNIQKIAKKKFEKIPVQLIGHFDRSTYKLVPDTMTVEITGGDRVLDSLSNTNLELFMEVNRFAIEDVDSLAPTVKLMLDPGINREMSIKAIQLIPEKVSLVKKEVKPAVNNSNDEDEDIAK